MLAKQIKDLSSAFTYSLMDATAIQGRHGSVCRARIVVLNKTVIETFVLGLVSATVVMTD